MTKPYINVYALFDGEGNARCFKTTEFTKDEIEEIKKDYSSLFCPAVLVTDPTLINTLPFCPEVYTAEPNKTLRNVSKLKINLLGYFLTVKTRIANYKSTSVTFMIVKVRFRAEDVTLWGYTCKMDTLPLCESYSLKMKQTDLLTLLSEKKVSILESVHNNTIKSRVTYTLSKK